MVIRGECDGVYRRCVSLKRTPEGLSRGDVPEADKAICAGYCKLSSVGTEGEVRSRIPLLSGTSYSPTRRRLP